MLDKKEGAVYKSRKNAPLGKWSNQFDLWKMTCNVPNFPKGICRSGKHWIIHWLILARSCSSGPGFFQSPIRLAACSLFLLSTRSAPELHTPRPSLSWPSHRSTTWPITLACPLSLSKTVSSHVFGRISQAGFLCYETQHFTSPWELLVIIVLQFQVRCDYSLSFCFSLLSWPVKGSSRGRWPVWRPIRGQDHQRYNITTPQWDI